MDSILVKNLHCQGKQQRRALRDLAKRRKTISNLALMLWNSPGTIALLAGWVQDIFPCLTEPSALTVHTANRAVDALALFQCIAGHPKTRDNFLEAHIIDSFLPLLSASNQDTRIEFVQITMLGVIVSLVKAIHSSPGCTDLDPELRAELNRRCKEMRSTGTKHLKWVATYTSRKLRRKPEPQPPEMSDAAGSARHIMWGSLERIADSSSSVSNKSDRSELNYAMWGDLEQRDGSSDSSWSASVPFSPDEGLAQTEPGSSQAAELSERQ
mmetsp:Transcript_3580/g.8436  ORF Transcript_3580/g.8436 Transcript_3580/m.8436 type:complete len:269 (-) Transcript_3580:161-967(-)